MILRSTLSNPLQASFAILCKHPSQAFSIVPGNNWPASFVILCNRPSQFFGLGPLAGFVLDVLLLASNILKQFGLIHVNLNRITRPKSNGFQISCPLQNRETCHQQQGRLLGDIFQKNAEKKRKLEANFWLQFLKPVLGFKGASSVMESEIFLPPKWDFLKPVLAPKIEADFWLQSLDFLLHRRGEKFGPIETKSLCASALLPSHSKLLLKVGVHC